MFPGPPADRQRRGAGYMGGTLGGESTLHYTTPGAGAGGGGDGDREGGGGGGGKEKEVEEEEVE